MTRLGATPDFERRVLLEQLRKERSTAGVEESIKQLMHRDWMWNLEDNPGHTVRISHRVLKLTDVIQNTPHKPASTNSTTGCRISR